MDVVEVGGVSKDFRQELSQRAGLQGGSDEIWPFSRHRQGPPLKWAHPFDWDSNFLSARKDALA